MSQAETKSAQSANNREIQLPDSLLRSLSLDLEVDTRTREITSAAAYRPDTGQTFTAKGPLTPTQLRRLQEMAEGANHLMGHNITAFDLPILNDLAPDLPMLRLPVLDTLMLNPLAFPRYPYHRLVKHYKEGGLVRRSHNDPLLDSKLALEALAKQYEQFKEHSSQLLLTAWHRLTSLDGNPAYGVLFSEARGKPCPADNEALQSVREFLDGRCCETRLTELAYIASSNPWPLAYLLAWLDTEGTNSAIPPWVLHSYPETASLAAQLRDRDCGDSGCSWCATRNNPVSELNKWFGIESFRPEPSDSGGTSLQQKITALAMQGQHTLGILPTGTGKSLCYQIPALSRYDKTSALTVVISPLVALMADQVAGLEEKGISGCVTVNGLLSMPERKDALDKVRLGEAAIVIISPESLRSPGVRQAIEQRQIGSYVLDEAHCLSKWGHDFRPDYRYIATFIKNLHPGPNPPPILCLTATAKPDVKKEIVQYFRDELNVELETVDGGSNRDNLMFGVQRTETRHKLAHLRDAIELHCPNGTGGVIIYRATRGATMETSEFLKENNISSRHFHAGLTPETKKQTQDDFKKSEVKVICATNAFGMGIDKDNVRLVIHGDIPSSLENYLQEAGRAGRDRKGAHCLLLYEPEDPEKQHSLQAMNSISPRDINALLKALRKMDATNKNKLPPGVPKPPVIATTGEIIKEDEEEEFEYGERNADTKARAAIAWLEEAGLLKRTENRVNVYPSSITAPNFGEARKKIWERFRRDPTHANRLLRLISRIVNSEPDKGISTDELQDATGMNHRQLRRATTQLEALGILRDDSALTAYVHYGTADSSESRLAKVSRTEDALILTLQEDAPDQEAGETQPLHINMMTDRLKQEGHDILPLLLLRMLRSLAGADSGTGEEKPALRVRSSRNETVAVTLNRPWSEIREGAAVRRKAAQAVLKHLISALPPNQRGKDLMADTTAGKLTEALRLEGAVPQGADPARLLQQSVLWLHEQEVIRLNQGMTIIRPAMTISVADTKREFKETDYEPLGIHYQQQTLQVHVMAEYAERGLDDINEATRMSQEYFKMPEEEFIAKWMTGKTAQLKRRTTPESYRRIVESLNNPAQRAVVTDNRETVNTLLLAGPGSGKTKTLVHRIAYLVRVKRENPESIIALAYNRHAAVQIKERLRELIGDDANRVTALTCHALAMRLTGQTFQSHVARNESEASGIFRKMLDDASELLEGKGAPAGDEDELREKLLAGFRWILVDEYQDIKEETYRLISALAGRTRKNPDEKLHIFAVGDDDQNIYAYDGASTRYIRHFQEEYSARGEYLTENYRSTGHIISAANAVIAPAADRLKRDQDITVDRKRTRQHPGGEWRGRDPVSQGKVHVISAGQDNVRQAQAVVGELLRLSELDPGWRWDNAAVVARNWSTLNPVRAACQELGIETQRAMDDFTATWQLRETQELLKFAESKAPLILPEDAMNWALEQPANRWLDLLGEAMLQLYEETEGQEIPVSAFREWLAEWARDNRRKQQHLLLSTAHRVKGLEFEHVVLLDGGDWRPRRDETLDDVRRVYYVAMTRAKQTLTLMDSGMGNPFLPLVLNGEDHAMRTERSQDRPPPQGAYDEVRPLALGDVDLSYAGYRTSEALHRALAQLRPGDPLEVDRSAEPWVFRTAEGVAVGRLSRKTQNRMPPGREVKAEVLAVARWSRDKSQPGYREGLRRDEWDVAIPQLTIAPRVEAPDKGAGGQLERRV